MLPIVKYPHPILRTPAQEISTISDELRTLADEMYATMLAVRGIGLAAPQIGRSLRLIVVDVSKERNQRITLFNPRITTQEGTGEGEEGCLSIPGVSATIKRTASVCASGLNSQGEIHEIKAEGLLAVCLQHEIDHLNGVLFVDHLSRFKRERLLGKYHKLQETNLKNNGTLPTQ
ncbi:peptide deformylase [Candidatus Persebacteraceae bacterium Df01]|jgi:peptide deformylase|uniref:Peptide deformylase n=1 Tax=Candidatus Doriopsillibacter californiensis TaxID=2970740 RepID=A0ABT7QN39_9GAMM|nr:peptide deformylase [Candidatus Persebacteraceae bacterium Df01]